jgi:hypothetical protein
MIGELDLQPGLQHLPDHRGQQTIVTRQLDALRTSTLDELLRPRIAGTSPATSGTLRVAGTNDTSSEPRLVVMAMILSGPQRHVADPQITPLTQTS